MTLRCLKMGVFFTTLACSSAVCADSPPAVPANMYLCAVKNANTGEMFYGKSIKKSYAEMYARATCQMKSHGGNCLVRAYCEFGSEATKTDE